VAAPYQPEAGRTLRANTALHGLEDSIAVLDIHSSGFGRMVQPLALALDWRIPSNTRTLSDLRLRPSRHAGSVPGMRDVVRKGDGTAAQSAASSEMKT
jgi:hypothetical protein